MVRFPKRRDKAASEIRQAMERLHRGDKISYDEIAGILIEYHQTILRALQHDRRPIPPLDAATQLHDIPPRC